MGVFALTDINCVYFLFFGYGPSLDPHCDGDVASRDLVNYRLEICGGPAGIDPLPEAGFDDGEGHDDQCRDDRIPDPQGRNRGVVRTTETGWLAD